jgi:uncharacterized protein
MADIVDEAVSMMETMMENNDGSHDAKHVKRVRRRAMMLAMNEGVVDPDDLLVVELAAILHDYDDHKYRDAHQLARSEESPSSPSAWLYERGYPETICDQVQSIIDGVSYSENECDGRAEPESLLHAIVQDADRLDAIGAVGIARVFMYAGSHGGTIQDAVQHFDDKLLKLYSLLKTKTAKTIGQTYHNVLLDFKAQISLEL